MNQFNSLANIAKDIYAVSTKSAREMVDMALNMSYLSSKCEVERVRGGRFCYKVLIRDVLVAAAEDYQRKKARATAYNAAADLLRMPYLCLEEKHDGIQLIGSNRPFVDMSLQHRDFRVNPPTQGFGWIVSIPLPV